MSFSFTAVGTKDHVVAQLRAVEPTTDTKLGREVALLIARHLEESVPQAHAGYEYAYTVEANGHSGHTSAMSLSVSVKPAWVRTSFPVSVDTGDDGQTVALD